MSTQQPRILLRPPPHRDYLQGYPGIPASDPTKDAPPPFDPLLSLAHVARSQAHFTGTVEIRRPTTKAGGLRAKWLSLELEKIETVPNPPAPGPNNAAANGGRRTGGGGGATSGDEAIGGGKKDGRFVELIGTGPSRLWVAGQDPGAGPDAFDHGDKVLTTSSRRRGLKGILKGGGPGHANGDDDDDGFDWIPDGNYPFKIPLPEGLPPTTEIDSKMHGISYQLVASLCTKGKKGILKGSSKPSILVASASVILHKADILPVWPVYAPLLPLPLPPQLPWASQDPAEPTIGETKEARLALTGDGRAGERARGEVWMKCTRKGSAFGPGDAVNVFVQLGWGGDRPIRLTRLDFVLRETLTYRYPSPSNPSYLVRAPPKVSSIFTANASVSPDPDNPVAFAVLYRDEMVGFDLNGIVPTGHMRVTVRTAKHIDVAYHLKIRAMIEGGDEISVDSWPVVIGNVNARVAKGIVNDIGYVEGLCERSGLVEPTPTSTSTSVSRAVPGSPGGPPFSNLVSQPKPSPYAEDALLPATTAATSSQSRSEPAASSTTNLRPPPPSSPLAQSSPGGYSDASTEKRQLLEARSRSFHVSNPNDESTSASPANRNGGQGTPERPRPLRPQFVPSPTAEEEKRRYYEQATRSRDHLQGMHAGSPVMNGDETTTTMRYRGMSSGGDTSFDPGSPSVVETDPPSPFAYHEASVLKLTRPSTDEPPSRTFLEHRRLGQLPGGGPESGATVTRSNTTMAFSGSAVSTVLREPSPDAPPPPRQPPPTVSSPPLPPQTTTLPAQSSSLSVGPALLGRSLTTAEAEKKRLFLEAKEMARQRQEEARIALERQNQLLEDLEVEEANREFEERLILEAEEERRREEERERDAFEAHQRDLVRLEEEKWQREEEERRRRALEELEERKRKAEMERLRGLERFEREQREAQERRQAEAERWAEERKQEDEMKKRKAEELKRQDEEREREEEHRRVAIARKAEVERQRAEDEQRRLAAEHARREEAERRYRAELEAQAARAAAARAEVERQRRAEEEAMAAQAEAEIRLREEHDRRLRAEEERRWQEEEVRRRVEQKREEAARLRAEEDARARQMRAEAEREASRQAYPASYNHMQYPGIRQPSTVSHHVGASLDRAPSVASFAPSMSAANADSAFYAQSIAAASPQGREAEKAAYLRQLRQGRSIGSTPPERAIPEYPSEQLSRSHGFPGREHEPSSIVHPSAPPVATSRYPSPLARSAAVSPDTSSRSAFATPTSPTIPETAPLSLSTSNSSQATRYRSAAEEKAELAAQRRAEDESRFAPVQGPPSTVGPADDDLPPSYPVPGSSAPTRARTGADEKEELSADYAAKQAVEDHRPLAPPVPPSRQASAPQYPASASASSAYASAPPHPSYAPDLQANGYPAASAPRPEAHREPSSASSSSNLEHLRDPEVSLGKQRAPGSISSSSWYPDSILHGYSPSAPLVPPPNGRDSAAYPNEANRFDPGQASSAGEADFASFHFETGFPEFDRIAQSIRDGQANGNGHDH
ncbi:hypothetical protein JCM10212_003737 [Sporobolomyces blumeae]